MLVILIVVQYLITWLLMQLDCMQENLLCMLDQQKETVDSVQDISVHKMR